MKLEDLYRIRLELNGAKIEQPSKMAEEKSLEDACWEGYEPIGLKPDGSPNCVPVQAKKVKQGFPIPSPSDDEDEDTFIGRCMKEIGGEYDQDQALAICYGKYKDK